MKAKIKLLYTWLDNLSGLKEKYVLDKYVLDKSPNLASVSDFSKTLSSWHLIFGNNPLCIITPLTKLPVPFVSAHFQSMFCWTVFSVLKASLQRFLSICPKRPRVYPQAYRLINMFIYKWRTRFQMTTIQKCFFIYEVIMLLCRDLVFLRF